MLRFLSALILFFLILAFSVFAIANREAVVVRFDFWNLSSGVDFANAFLFQVPLYIIIFIGALLGMFVGMLLPLLGFVRRQRLSLKKKMNQPLKPPPPREPPPPPPAPPPPAPYG